jgi:hypothetical protein
MIDSTFWEKAWLTAHSEEKNKIGRTFWEKNIIGSTFGEKT